jgi:hypothetical protein
VAPRRSAARPGRTRSARHSRISLDLNLGQYLQPGYHGPHWTADELALLGTMPDEEVAARIGRPAEFPFLLK